MKLFIILSCFLLASYATCIADGEKCSNSGVNQCGCCSGLCGLEAFATGTVDDSAGSLNKGSVCLPTLPCSNDCSSIIRRGFAAFANVAPTRTQCSSNDPSFGNSIYISYKSPMAQSGLIQLTSRQCKVQFFNNTVIEVGSTYKSQAMQSKCVEELESEYNALANKFGFAQCNICRTA